MVERNTKKYLDTLNIADAAKESALTYIKAIQEGKFIYTATWQGGVKIDMNVRSKNESYYTEIEWDADGEQVLD